MRRRLLLAATVATLPLPLAPALAQDAEAGPQADDAIVVTGQRAQLERSIEIKREALGVVDAASADDIGQLPDRNVAEVVERLPGVGVQYDQGEGRYVSVRGVPAELNQYTINGFEVGNPDGDSRRLPLDVVSGQLLNRIEVFKVKTSDQDGQGIGGLINLVPQTAFDFRQPLIAIANAQVGLQQIDDRNPVRGDVTLGARTGDVGLLAGFSYSDRTFNSYGVFPDDWVPIAGAARGGLPINIKFSEYEIKRERIGVTGSIDWRPGPTQLWVRGLYSRFTEDEYRQRYRLDFADDAEELIAAGDLVLDAGGATGTSFDTGIRQDLRLEYKEKSILAAMAGGTTKLSDWTFDYGIARIHNEVIEPNRVWQFRNASDIGPVDFDFSDILFTAEPRDPVPASNIQFRQLTEQDEVGDEDIWQFRGDAKYQLSMNESSFVRLGAKYRTADKAFDAANRRYNRGDSSNRFTLVDAGAAGGAVEVPVRPDERTYVIPISIDADAIVNFTEGRLGGPLFVLNEDATLEDAVLDDLDIDEDVLAGYAMANLDWQSFAVTAGIRVERTELKIGGFQLENGTTVVPVSEDNSYTNWLPSLIGRYTPTSEVIVRAAYHRSIGRPQYSDLSPGGEVTIEADEAFVRLGNPRLKPYVSDNLDLSAEYYFAPGGYVSAAAFAKFIKDPIFNTSFTVDNASFRGADFARIEFTQPLNGSDAEIYGLELAFEQQFTFLPGALSGLGLGANLTLVDSKLEVADGSRTVSFPEQSDLLYGVRLFYQRGPVEGSIAYHHTGRALLSIGGEEFEDQYNNDLRRLDAKLSVQVHPQVRLFVEGQNLTDEPTRQYQGGRRDWIIQEERYGRALWAGASLKL